MQDWAHGDCSPLHGDDEVRPLEDNRDLLQLLG